MDCPHVPDLAFSDLAKRIRAKARKDRVPLSGMLELTYRCNNDCVHCYCNLPAGDAEARSRELSTGQVKAILDEVADAGCLYLTITGGEPLLRADFADIYVHAKEKGFLVSLMTNGTLITDEVADLLAEYYPLAVAITLYGMTRESYERVSRTPGSYARSLAGIDRLMDRGIKPNLRTIAMVANSGEIAAMRAFARERELKFQFDPLLSPRKDGGSYDFGQRLSPEEIVEIDLLDEERIERLREFTDEWLSIPPDEELFRCGAGLFSFSLNPYGELGMCLMSSPTFPGYDLLSGSFDQGWWDHIPRQRNRKVTRSFACVTCDKRIFCGWCPAWSDLENGDPESPVEYLCQVANLRAAVLGLGSRGQR